VQDTHRVVRWSDAYALQLPAVDAQHRHLFDLINALWAAVRAPLPAPALLVAVATLEQHTLAHFADEEHFMRLMDYPLLPEHALQHQRFLAHLAAERQRVEAGQGLLPAQAQVITDWLLDHIDVSDRSYAAFTQLEQQAEVRARPLPGRASPGA
jgi:hemerythrin